MFCRIGDAYVVLGGLPFVQIDLERGVNLKTQAAINMIQMAIDMIKAVNALQSTTGISINVRVGLHTGKIIAGVIGATKFRFDIWGKDAPITWRTGTSYDATKAIALFEFIKISEKSDRQEQSRKRN